MLAVTVIGINAHLLSGESGYRRAGIHHYISQLLHHLPPHPDWHYLVFTQNSDELPAHLSLQWQPTKWPTHNRWVRIGWEQLILPSIIRQKRLQLLHSMAFSMPILGGCPTVVTIYDLSFIHYPERFPALQHWYLRWQTSWSCRHARQLVAISQDGKQDIQQQFHVPPSRISVVYPAVESRFRPLPASEVEQFRQQKGLPPQFILHIGTLQPRKNIPVLLQAFAQLRQRTPHRYAECKLILVGGKGWFYEEIFAQVQQLDLATHVHFAGYVPDEELPWWYNSSHLLVFPSIYEGFGLPIIQAMACGTPVIAANTSAIPEVAGIAALLFHPQNISALTDQLQALLTDNDLHADLRQKGLEQSQKFTWSKSGQQLLDVYRQALSPL